MRDDVAQPGSDEEWQRDREDFRALLLTHDEEGLVAALDSPELYRFACDDERYLEIAMQGIAVLAWSDPARASKLLVHYDAERLRELAASPARQAARSLMAAVEWRQLSTSNVVPGALLKPIGEFLALAPALGSEGPHADALQASMAEHPERYAQVCQQLADRAQVLPGWIERLASEKGDVPGPLAEVEQKVQESLGPPWLVYSALATAMGAFIVFGGAVGGLVATLSMGASLAFGQTREYQQKVRPHLVAVAISHGVGGQALLRWLYRDGARPTRLRRFDLKIENDAGLELLAGLARSSAPG